MHDGSTGIRKCRPGSRVTCYHCCSCLACAATAEGNTSSGSVWVSWSTGLSSFFPNQEAPAYPSNTIYAPQTPDPASVASVVRRSQLPCRRALA